MSGVCVSNRTKIARWARTLSVVAGFAAAAVLQAPISRAADPPDDRSWQAVAPGRVEPWSGEIKIAAPVVGRIGEVLVGVNDRVFVGEPLIRLEDDEARARIATLASSTFPERISSPMTIAAAVGAAVSSVRGSGSVGAGIG